MTRKEFNQYIQEASFQELFVTEMGWNNPKGMTDIIVPHIDEIDYEMEVIAERNGFQILTCLVEKIPTASTCKKIDIKLRQQAHDYICIYIEQQSFHHQWVAPVNKVEKRDIVTIEYASVAQAEFLYTKIPDLSFDLNEDTTIMDVKQRIQGAFMVNSEKITKDFYAGFKKEHTQFVKYITGINDEITDDKKNKEKQWYASVMLNRLMFCYFIQKKGFLDMNENYLRDKLSMVQRERGENEFFQSFYKGFLIHLFHEGLNGHQRNEAFLNKYGRIPYLNGGTTSKRCSRILTSMTRRSFTFSISSINGAGIWIPASQHRAKTSTPTCWATFLSNTSTTVPRWEPTTPRKTLRNT